MNEWQMVLALGTLAGFVGVFVSAASKLTQAIVRLTTEIQELFRWRDESKVIHNEIKADVQHNTERIDNHETRLQLIERDKS